MKTLFLMSASASLMAASPALAQTATVAPVAASATQCELHVWPAERFQARTSGWGVGFGMIGAMIDASGHANGDKARRSNLAAALDPEGQVEALKSLDLLTLLQLPATTTVVSHNDPLDRKTLGKINTRRSDSVSPCYTELMVSDVLYTKAAMWGRSLRTGFTVRKFGASNDAPAKSSSTGGNKLKLFPPKEGDDVTASNQELVDMFKKDFVEAAGNLSRQATGG